jgi:hypothetical protein
MTSKFTLAASLLMAFAGAAQAQSTTACTCDSGATRLDGGTLAGLLTNRMVCANVGGEAWQELHVGAASGTLRDYKKGPSDPVDPSTPVGSSVGSYSVDGATNTISYTYPGQPAYKYDVCLTGTNGYTFCGATYGGRNITGARIGGTGMTDCSAVTNTPVLSVIDRRVPATKKPPVSAPATRAP